MGLCPCFGAFGLCVCGHPEGRARKLDISSYVFQKYSEHISRLYPLYLFEHPQKQLRCYACVQQVEQPKQAG